MAESEAMPFDQAEQGVNGLLAKGLKLAYWSGGFDLGFHSNTIVNFKFNLPGDVKVVAGIEPNSYIENKGREAQFDQITRLSAVGLLLKQVNKLGIVFPIPEREGRDTNQFYDQLVKQTGMYRRPGCFHLYAANDPHKEIKIERMTKPEPWCCLQLMRDKSGEPFSTTKLLGLE